MRTLRWTTSLALVAFAAAPVGAQQMGTMHGDRGAGHDGGMMGQGMMQMCPMMGGQGMAGHTGMMAGMDRAGPGAEALFGGVDPGLTADQRAKLDELVSKAREEHRAHMQEAMSVQGAATEALAGEHPDLVAYERSLEEAATHGVQAHLVLAKASVEARTLLTPDQLAKLPEGAQLFNGMMCGMMGAGMMGPGAMQGGPSAGGHEQYHR